MTLKPRILLITSNAGSLFEKDCRLHVGWLQTIEERVHAENIDMLVLHTQETGGKKFEECSYQVPIIVDQLRNRLNEFQIIRAWADIEYESEDYTALGVYVFIKESAAKYIEQYNFHTNRFETLHRGFSLTLSNFEKNPYLIKYKFPKEFWPAIKWGRKGYMHTRWRISNRIIDFVNAHLFHDESNLALIHENPMQYSENRKRAMDFIIQRLAEFANGHKEHLFIFGDLNFRLDSTSFLNRITAKTEPHPLDDEDESRGSTDHLQVNGNNCPNDNLRRTVSAIEFRRGSNDSQNSCVLRVEKKKFDYFNQKKLLDDWESYLDDDKEAKSFPLNELPISFPPT
ncbi:hypothetical protein WR25_21699 [Diploscapter pachys]|uniref:inositol-polyphosphate 5-phosphatase n=1 Tax=Diploscapter pachys TaxID=2018661 RepID=A0A2A2LBL8_9BILA|nr:hypothetical protein WR25_21699 [Diploscapter pachys]